MRLWPDTNQIAGSEQAEQQREFDSLYRKSHWRCDMAQNVADLLWEMLEKAG